MQITAPGTETPSKPFHKLRRRAGRHCQVQLNNMFKVNNARTSRLFVSSFTAAPRRDGTKDWDSTIVDAGPGEIVGETEHAATLLCKGAEDFEGKENEYPNTGFRSGV